MKSEQNNHSGSGRRLRGWTPLQISSAADLLASEQILTLTLNRPDKLNAVTVSMVNELIDAIERANKDDDVRAIIVTGEGRAFCAGADMNDPDSNFESTGQYEITDERARDSAGRIWPAVLRAVFAVDKLLICFFCCRAT